MTPATIQRCIGRPERPPDAPPEYTKYRSRPRLFGRAAATPSERRAGRRPARASRRSPDGAGSRRPGPWRVVRWVVLARRRLARCSRSCSSSSARRSSRARSPTPPSARSAARLPAHEPEHHPRPRAPTSAARPRPSRAPRRARRAARTRSCCCASAAGRNARLSIPATRSSTSPATAATRSTPPTPSAARRSPSRRSSSTRASTVNHLIEVNFDELPGAHRRAWAASTTRAAASSPRSTAATRTAASRCALQAGHDHLNGDQALALARTRKNACNARENDLDPRAPPAAASSPR